LLSGILLTTLVWVAVTYMTRPEPDDVLIAFCRKIRAGGPGWRRFEAHLGGDVPRGAWDVPLGILCMLLGCVAVWSALFSIGELLYGQRLLGSGLGLLAILATCVLMKCIGKVKYE
jgi:hypothetical protein